MSVTRSVNNHTSTTPPLSDFPRVSVPSKPGVESLELVADLAELYLRFQLRRLLDPLPERGLPRVNDFPELLHGSLVDPRQRLAGPRISASRGQERHRSCTRGSRARGVHRRGVPRHASSARGIPSNGARSATFVSSMSRLARGIPSRGFRSATSVPEQSSLRNFIPSSGDRSETAREATDQVGQVHPLQAPPSRHLRPAAEEFEQLPAAAGGTGPRPPSNCS